MGSPPTHRWNCGLTPSPCWGVRRVSFSCLPGSKLGQCTRGCHSSRHDSCIVVIIMCLLIGHDLRPWADAHQVATRGSLLTSGGGGKWRGGGGSSTREVTRKPTTTQHSMISDVPTRIDCRPTTHTAAAVRAYVGGTVHLFFGATPYCTACLTSRTAGSRACAH